MTCCLFWRKLPPTLTSCTPAKQSSSTSTTSAITRVPLKPARLVDEWTTLKGQGRSHKFFDDVHLRSRLLRVGHAIVWRDAIVQYFLKQSGVPDREPGRAGKFPGLAQQMKMHNSPGYQTVDVNPWEDASRGKAVSCDQSLKS